ncbi:hypothetical protein PROFUN_15162, partial [Planoprotostelium fungivorum]
PFHHWGKWGSETPAYIILTQTDALITTVKEKSGETGSQLR